MPQVISNSTLVDMQPGWWPSSYGSITMYDQFSYDYATLYSSQPNIRTCVDFLARNIAQLGIHVFKRDEDGDKIRLYNHPMNKVLSRPLPNEYKVTRYKMIEALVADFGIYYNAYMLKIKIEGAPLGLLRLPPQYVRVHGGLVPTKYEFNYGGEVKIYSPETIVHIGGYNPNSQTSGLSPLETLRRILAEEDAAGKYRENFGGTPLEFPALSSDQSPHQNGQKQHGLGSKQNLRLCMPGRKIPRRQQSWKKE